MSKRLNYFICLTDAQMVNPMHQTKQTNKREKKPPATTAPATIEAYDTELHENTK